MCTYVRTPMFACVLVLIPRESFGSQLIKRASQSSVRWLSLPAALHPVALRTSRMSVGQRPRGIEHSFNDIQATTSTTTSSSGRYLPAAGTTTTPSPFTCTSSSSLATGVAEAAATFSRAASQILCGYDLDDVIQEVIREK